MPRIDVVANPETTTEAVVTVTNPNKEKFRVRVVFYPNRMSRTRRHENGNNGSGDALIDQLADGVIVGEVEDDEGEFDPAEREKRRNDEALMRAATAFCETYKSWDLTGPLVNGEGKTIVPEDEPIPIEPGFVRWVPLWLRAEINAGVQDILFPTLREFKPSRKR